MSYYLLTLEEGSRDNYHQTKHLIEAENPQMVKYHFHRSLKDWGYTDYPSDKKHRLHREEGFAEIKTITELDHSDYHTLNKYIDKWMKV